MPAGSPGFLARIGRGCHKGTEVRPKDLDASDALDSRTAARQSKITDLLKGTETHSGATRKKTGAGPSPAAHSKDAKSKEPSDQNKKAART